MQKKEAKKARKRISKKTGKELERRIEEERKRILERERKKKGDAKEAKPKKQKKDKDISDKVKTKARKKIKGEDLQKKIDYHKFLEMQLRKLDYAAMFSYLGGGIKTPTYDYTNGESEITKAIHKKYETVTWEEVKQVTNEEKMNQLMGLNRNFEVNETREGYGWWKAFNKGLGELLYQVSMT